MGEALDGSREDAQYVRNVTLNVIWNIRKIYLEIEKPNKKSQKRNFCTCLKLYLMWFIELGKENFKI